MPNDSPAAATIEAIRSIAQKMGSQDNRCTSWPIYVVEQLNRIYGIDPDYGEHVAWLDVYGGHEEAGDAKAAELEKTYGESGHEPEGWQRAYFFDTWEFVSPFFTNDAAEAFISANKHRLREPRVYVHSGYRNHEWQAVVTHIRAVAKDSAGSLPDSHPVDGGVENKVNERSELSPLEGQEGTTDPALETEP